MTCLICHRELNTDDPLSRDCGGDCLECMADVGGDEDCIREVELLRRIERLEAAVCAVAAARNQRLGEDVARMIVGEEDTPPLHMFRSLRQSIKRY